MASNLPHKLIQVPPIVHRQGSQEARDHEDRHRQDHQEIQNQEDRPRRDQPQGIQPRPIALQVQVGRCGGSCAFRRLRFA